MSSQEIKTKAEYYKLARQHLLGNTIRQWDWDYFVQEHAVKFYNPGNDSDHWISTLPDIVAMRGMTADSKKVQAYDLTLDQAMIRGLKAIRDDKINPKHILVDEQAPDDQSTLKGEVMRPKYGESYLYMRCDQTPGLRMRQAYPTMKHIWGLQAVNLLKSHLDASSWDCLQDIFDMYPDAIVELSCYSKSVGIFGWNTIFWEVRTNY